MMEEQAKALVARSCLLLDDEKFDEYLSLFSETSRYRITAFSPDLRKDQTWLDLDRTQLGDLLHNIPRHVRVPGRLLRHPNGFLVETGPDAGSLSVTTSLLVIHTNLDGSSRVFAAGRYYDVIDAASRNLHLRERLVRLDTRTFGPGTHMPM